MHLTYGVMRKREGRDKRIDMWHKINTNTSYVQMRRERETMMIITGDKIE
jgi:hypothetical protein